MRLYGLVVSRTKAPFDPGSTAPMNNKSIRVARAPAPDPAPECSSLSGPRSRPEVVSQLARGLVRLAPSM